MEQQKLTEVQVAKYIEDQLCPWCGAEITGACGVEVESPYAFQEVECQNGHEWRDCYTLTDISGQVSPPIPLVIIDGGSVRAVTTADGLYGVLDLDVFENSDEEVAWEFTGETLENSERMRWLQVNEPAKFAEVLRLRGV